MNGPMAVEEACSSTAQSGNGLFQLLAENRLFG